MPPCTRTGRAGRGSMCEPRLEPGPASLRHPAARRHRRLGGARRSAPGGAGGFSPELGGGRARPCCPACTRPSCGAAPPELAASPPGGHSLPPPFQAALAQPPATCGVLLSSPPCKGSTPLSAPSDFGCSCHPELPPAGPAPPVPASLRAIPLKGCSCRSLSQSLVDSVWDEGWRLPARERRPLGSFPFAK